MRLELKNINKIAYADVRLNGLTVIAGTNDSGKSTVGKALFSVVKSIGLVKTLTAEVQRERIRKLLHRLERGVFTLSRESGNQSAHDLMRQIEDFKQQGDVVDDRFFMELSKFIEDSAYIVPRSKAALKRSLEELERMITEMKCPDERLRIQLQRVMGAEFDGHVCTWDTAGSEINFEEEENENKLCIRLENDKVMSAEAQRDSEFTIEDASFIESPLYMHLIDALLLPRASSGLARGYDMLLNYHVDDFIRKLGMARFASSYSSTEDSAYGDLFDKSAEITGGRFVFDATAHRLLWEKDGRKYSPVNVASGVKSFGVMQLLIGQQVINENRLLIWDEPENHLHPEWQIRLAELLVDLSLTGVPVLISSHSPYFIQAIRFYSQKRNNAYVDYYLTEEVSEGLVRIEDVTKDLNRIFTKLSKPMSQIVNFRK
ncbi:AAA family ATPase [Parabacteroides sp. ZJ-118]|uniref:AAA family ATPase n=1 Tax=Parabacteroides sp. ZJ-118 TaxID=2709398 RepID=UPI0013E9AE2A|nr:AAA family ATPase [Parabacteroides sp. ZJ-118]